MERTHRYEVSVTWTGNTGAGTRDYRGYERAHDIEAPGKPPIPGSSDPSFRGEATRWNPEELLVVSLSQCHMLWYLGLCAGAGIVVTGYVDRPVGTMREDASGAGRFTEVVLRPEVTLARAADTERAIALHERAHRMCFIANSVTFPVRYEPTVRQPAVRHER